MRFSILSKTAFAAVLGFGMVGGAQAALVSTLITAGANDCSGVFGTAPNCNVLGPTGTKFSPLVVKYDMNDSGTTVKETTINSAEFPTFLGGEITLNFAGPDGSGTWTYTQGTGDPNIKYWVAKASNDFNLFWMVADAEVAAGGACAVTVYSDACLAKALVQTSGSFSTPGDKKLSHVGFYDTARPPEVVPLPAAAWLLLSGLGGLGLLGRRRKAV